MVSSNTKGIAKITGLDSNRTTLSASEQLSPLNRGFMGVFLLAPGTGQYEIQLSPTHKQGFEPDIMLETSLLSQNDPNLADLKTIGSALTEWRQVNFKSRNEAIRLLSSVHNVSKNKSIYFSLYVQVYAAMLYRTERFSSLEQLVTSHFNKSASASCDKGCLKDQTVVRLYMAAAYQQLRHFKKSLNEYQWVFDSIKDADYTTFKWLLYRTEATQGLAHMSFLEGHHANDKGKIDQAKRLANASLVESKRIGNKTTQAAALSTLAFLNYNSGSPIEGERSMLKAVQLHEQIGNTLEGAASISNYATLINRRGEIANAILRYHQALKIHDEYPDNSQKAHILINLADRYVDIASFENAKAMAVQAKAIFEATNNTSGLAVVNNLLGEIYFELSKFKDSELSWYESLNTYSGNKESSNALFAGLIRLKLLRLFSQLKNKERAERLLAENKQFLDDLLESKAYRDIPQVNQALYAMAEFHTAFENRRQFQYYYSVFEELLIQQGNPEVFLEKQHQFSTLKLKWAIRDGIAEDIKRQFLTGINTLNALHQKIDTSLLGNVIARRIDQHIQPYLIYLYKSNTKYAAKEIYFVLEEYLSSLNRTELSPGELASNSDQTQTLDRALESQREVVGAKKSSDKNIALSKVAISQAPFLIRRSQNSGSLEHQNFSIDEIIKRIPDDTVMLRFYLRERANFALQIRNNGARITEIDGKPEIAEQIEKLRYSIANQSSGTIEHATQLSAALGLSNLNLNGLKTIVIVTDGLLDSVPYGALNLNDTAKEYSPIGTHISLIRSNSFSEYLQDRERTSNQLFNDIGIFADPMFDEQELFESSQLDTDTNRKRDWQKGLSRLPWTGKEAEAIQSIFPRRRINVALRDQATSQALLSSNMRHSKILHIASHGYFNDSSPNVVGIATAGPNVDFDPSAGFVSLTALLQNSFPSNLIVVSGCDTSLGVEVSGIGLNSLARGFIARGAGSVIGTLWAIPDRPTAKFMETFYRELERNDGNASDALRLTKKHLSESGRFRHPYYWSSFALYTSNKSSLEDVFTD